MSFFNTLKEIFFWIWQLPQNLLGLLLLLWYKITAKDLTLYHKENGRYFYSTIGMLTGISLGNYIIMRTPDMGDGKKHEYGHSRQSRILGPLYLLVIGLPSICGNLYDLWFHTPSRGWSYWDSYVWYYNQPWEKWADKLGGVNRFGSSS